MLKNGIRAPPAQQYLGEEQLWRPQRLVGEKTEVLFLVIINVIIDFHID